ncbi:MAG: NAD(P)-dependent oxidoreductase [Alphaproteobacteria bacterium]|nr:NAD(P)-dependent oxidoreductase [Alphaproteobacteria bacterium]
MKVGFIGLGRMGQAMARRMLDAGHDLAVYNRTAEKAKALAEAGAKVMGSVAEAARYGEAVVTMLADDAALEKITAQKDGLLQSLPKGSIHVCAGTHSVEIIRSLDAAHAKAGQRMVASPMLGRPEAVAAGQAGIVVGGAAESLACCRPLFEAIARRVFEAGADPVTAAAIKIANNFVLGCAIEAMGEGLSLVRKYGVAPQVLYDVMTDGLFAAPAYKIYGQIIVDETYEKVGQMAVLGLKDANLALAAGEAVGVPLPSGNVWRDRLVGAVAHGDGQCDWAVMAREQARASGLV